MKYSRLVLSALVTVLSFSQLSSAALYLRSYDAKRNDRFYSGSDKAFIGQEFDWSGVGRSATNGRWATMISPSYFVSAEHYHPQAGESITFYEGNSQTGASHTYTVASTGWSLPIYEGGKKTDLWVGKLSEPIPASDHIATYPIARCLNEAGERDDDLFNSQTLFVYGQTHRVGQNQFEDWSITTTTDPKVVNKATTTFSYDYDVNGGTGADEAYVMTGDSGAPTFVVQNGRLALVGIHYLHTSDTVGQGQRSIDSFVPYYADALETLNGSESLTIVPEPVTCAFFVLGSLAFIRGVRKRG